MGKSDTLSCRADHGSGANDNEDIVLLMLDLFAIWALERLELIGEEREMEEGERDKAVSKASAWKSS